jgi:hypothetical protein
MSLWTLNQRKNFYPVLSLNTNFTFKINPKLDYSNLSSVIEILNVLNVESKKFELNPKVKNLKSSAKDSANNDLIGREVFSSETKITIYETEDKKNASSRLKDLRSSVGSSYFTYKNLIIEGESSNKDFIDLKEKLNVK